MAIPFGEVGVLDDGRLVITPWLKPGCYVGTQFVDGPVMLCPDAAIDAQGRVWISGHNAQTDQVHVTFVGAGQWWTLPVKAYGRRGILRTTATGCEVAITTTGYAWARYAVTPTGVMTQIDTGTIPSGDGGLGMAGWAGNVPLPLSPLDTTLLGHKVRSKLSVGDVIVACGLFVPDQVVMAKGGKLGTLHQPEVDWVTIRLSANGKYWAGAKYVGEQVYSGAVPSVVPPLVETTTPAPQPQPEPKPVPRPNHIDVVQKWCDVAAGKFPVGPDRGFYVLNKVCQELASEGYGLIAKTTGNNYKGYSVDKIIQKDGSGVDILTGPNNDQASWSEITPTDGANWRPAMDVDSSPTPNPVPDPQPAPQPGGVDLTPILNKLDAQSAVIVALIQAIQQVNGKQGEIITGLNQLGVDVNKVRPVVMNGKVLGFGATFNGQVG